MAVWCKYKNSAKIIKFDDPMKVPQKIVCPYGLNNVEIYLQYFNKDFQEYVDLDDISAIESNMKLKANHLLYK